MINSLSDLIDNLKKVNPKDYPKLIKQINIPHSEFDKYVNWTGNTYSRNCIARDEKFELILLCWEETQSTPIHNHDGEKCWVYQIKGRAEELRYELNENNELEIKKRLLLSPGDLSYMDDKIGFHCLKTLDQKVLSLHIYANPIDKCEVYNTISKSFETKKMIYNTNIEK